MRVAIVVYGNLDTLSGGYLYDRELAACLRSYGDEVQVISQPWSNYLDHLALNFQSAWSEELARLKVDIVLEDELNHPSLLLANRQFKQRDPAPLVSIVHHLRSSEAHPALPLRLYRWVERAYLSSVSQFVFNCQTTRTEVEHLLGRPAAGVVATPGGDRFGQGLSEDEIQRRCQAGGSLRILFIGNLIARKGLHTLLLALATLRERDWYVRVVGRSDVDPAYAASLGRLVERERISQRVVFLGQLDEAALKLELTCADVLVMVSSYEGFGIVYLEGMAFGLPAIASLAGGAGELVQDGINGYLVPPEDPQALAMGLRVYLDDRPTLMAHSLAARRRFDLFPGWEASMHKIREYLVGLTSPSG